MSTPRPLWLRWLPWTIVALALLLPVAVIGLVDERLEDDSDLRVAPVAVAHEDNMRGPWQAAKAALSLTKAQEEALRRTEPVSIPVLTDELRAMLDANAAVVEQCRIALARPAWSWPAMSSPSSPMPRLMNTRQVGEIWSLEVARLHESGEHAAAREAALALARAGAKMEANPSSLIDFCIGTAVRNQGTDLAFACARAQDLSADELDALALELDGLRPDVAGLEQALLVEYVVLVDILDTVENEGAGKLLNTQYSALDWFQYKPHATRNGVAAAMRTAIADLRAGRKPTSPSALAGKEQFAAFLRGNLTGDIVMTLAPRTPDMAGMCLVLDETRVAVRILAFEQRHGALPADLSELSLPVDAFPNTLPYDAATRTVGGGRGVRLLEF